MIIVKDNGCDVNRAYGLTQYDYGQELMLEDMDVVNGTEVHFCQRGKAITRQLFSNKVSIPDYMLQYAEEINAYLYRIDGKSGETIRKIIMQISPRERPSDYAAPDEPVYARLIPFGGLDGQFLLKRSGDDFACGWGDAATDLSMDKDGGDHIIQLMMGNKKIGNSIRLPSLSGREVEISNNGSSIQWRYTDSNDWIDLASLSSLTGPPGPPGPPGETPELEIREGNLYAIYH